MGCKVAHRGGRVAGAVLRIEGLQPHCLQVVRLAPDDGCPVIRDLKTAVDYVSGFCFHMVCCIATRCSSAHAVTHRHNHSARHALHEDDKHWAYPMLSIRSWHKTVTSNRREMAHNAAGVAAVGVPRPPNPAVDRVMLAVVRVGLIVQVLDEQVHLLQAETAGLNLVARQQSGNITV